MTWQTNTTFTATGVEVSLSFYVDEDVTFELVYPVKFKEKTYAIDGTLATMGRMCDALNAEGVTP